MRTRSPVGSRWGRAFTPTRLRGVDARSPRERSRSWVCCNNPLASWVMNSLKPTCLGGASLPGSSLGGVDGEDGATVDAARADQGRARDAGAFRAAAEDRPEACASLAHRVAMRRGPREARPGEADGRVSIHGLASLARVRPARPSRRDLSTLQQTFLRREGARHRGPVRESARSRCCASGAETRRWQGARPSHSSATAQGAQRSQRRWIGVRTSRQSWVRLLAPARRSRLPGARVRYARRHRSPLHARKV